MRMHFHASVLHTHADGSHLSERVSRIQAIQLHGLTVGSSPRLPGMQTGRSGDLCLLGVPSHMTGSDLCNFTGSFLANIRAIRIVRNDAVEERYMVLLKMDSQASADDFFRYFNGKEFSPLEPDLKCLVLFASSVHFTNVEEEAATAPDGLTELPTCTFCLGQWSPPSPPLLEFLSGPCLTRIHFRLCCFLLVQSGWTTTSAASSPPCATTASTAPASPSGRTPAVP